MSDLKIRRAADRGRTREKWLDSRHTFSFADYQDPEQQGFRSLRVINEDWVAPSSGFGPHPHRDMEILTFMLEGALEHRDSLGERVVLHAGAVQRMTAGTGVLHSELNPSDQRENHFFQIWIRPEVRALEPSYEQRAFPDGWQLIASPDGRDGSLVIHRNVRVYRGEFEAPRRQLVALAPGRHGWVQVMTGDIEVTGTRLGPGSGVGIAGPRTLEIVSDAATQYLVFDLD